MDSRMWAKIRDKRIESIDESIEALRSLRDFYMKSSYPLEKKRSDDVSPAGLREKMNTKWEPGY